MLSEFLLDGWMGGWVEIQYVDKEQGFEARLTQLQTLVLHKFFKKNFSSVEFFVKFLSQVFPLLNMNNNSHLTGLFVNSEQVIVISLL